MSDKTTAKEAAHIPATTIGSVVFGPRWDKPTAVGEGRTFTLHPVYIHEMKPLLDKIAELEARIAKLENQNASE